MDFIMALRAFWKRLIIDFFKRLNPQLSIKVSGFELSYNYPIGSSQDGRTGDSAAQFLACEKTHQWFVLQCMDVDLLRVCNRSGGGVHDIWELTAFGYKKTTKTNLITEQARQFGGRQQISNRPSVSRRERRVEKHTFFDWKLVNLLLAVMVLATCSMYLSHLLPNVIKTLIPALLQPIGQMSILTFMISYRTLVALAQLQLAVINLVVSRAKQRVWKDYVYPFLHPRIFFFVAIIPAIVYGYYPAIFLLCATGLISLYDILNAQQSLFMFHLPICFLYLNIGCDLREGHKNFQAACVDFPLYRLGKDTRAFNKIREENAHLNPDFEQVFPGLEG